MYVYIYTHMVKGWTMVIWPTSWSVSLRKPPAIMPACEFGARGLGFGMIYLHVHEYTYTNIYTYIYIYTHTHI